MNNVNKTQRKNVHIPLEKYKDYFKSFVRFKKNSHLHKTYLNSMYLQFRDKYQKFVINKKNSFGLKLEGNKRYENLPINIFQDNYILNTLNISKELENNALEYFFPYETKELSPEKEIEGEKIKLTPIPYKNGFLINSNEERKKIQEAKRSAVLMRRVEYTHLIKKTKSNNNEKNDEMENKDALIWNEKIYILKGAIIIIEDWWKKMRNKRGRNKNKSKRRKNKINLNNESVINRNKNDFNLNLYSNENKTSYKLNKNNSYKIFKSSDKNENKYPKKLNIEKSYTINQNNLKTNNSNKINLKLSSNKNNNSASLNRKILKHFQNKKSNKNKKIQEKIIKINEKEKDENKIILNQPKNNNVNNIIKSPKRKKRKIKNKSINNKINDENVIDSKKIINAESINKIKEKIYKAILKNNERNKRPLNNYEKKTYNNKTSNYRNNKKNIVSQNSVKKPLNNLKIQNHLKNKNSNEFVYEQKDIIKINDLINNTNNSSANKDNNYRNKNIMKKPNLELNLKTNYDMDRKNTFSDERKIESAQNNDNKQINNLGKITLGNEINTENNVQKNLFDKTEENNNKRVKYVESKENEIQILSLKKNKNDIFKNLNINLNDINNNNIKEFLENNSNKAENINNINLDEKTLENNKKDNFNDENNNNSENNDLIKQIIKRNKSYSFKEIKKENNNISKDDSKKSKDDSKIFNESSNKVKKLYDIYKNEEFYINNDIMKEKKFANLEVEENKNNLSFLNSKRINKKIENVKNSFELEIISDKKNQLKEPKQLKIKNEFLTIKNESQNLKKNIPFSIDKLEIELKGDNLMNAQIEDSDIIPIEKDNTNPIIFIKSPKDNTIKNNQISSNINLYIKNTYSSNDENRLNSKNDFKNNDQNSEEDLSDDSIGNININLPKLGKYNLLEKITYLFPQNIKENIEKNKNDKKINMPLFNKNNNIEINNLKINNANYYFFDSNLNYNIQRSKSENKGKKINCVKTNLSKGVSRNIRENYKIYKKKSVTVIKRGIKKEKNFEYLRDLENKFDFQ